MHARPRLREGRERQAAGPGHQGWAQPLAPALRNRLLVCALAMEVLILFVQPKLGRDLLLGNTILWADGHVSFWVNVARLTSTPYADGSTEDAWSPGFSPW